jgi:hypothetical protein
MGITGYLLVSSTGSGTLRLLIVAVLPFFPEVPEAAGAGAGAGDSEAGLTRRRNAGPGFKLLRYRSVSVSQSHCCALVSQSHCCALNARGPVVGHFSSAVSLRSECKVLLHAVFSSSHTRGCAVLRLGMCKRRSATAWYDRTEQMLT